MNFYRDSERDASLQKLPNWERFTSMYLFSRSKGKYGDSSTSYSLICCRRMESDLIEQFLRQDSHSLVNIRNAWRESHNRQ